MRIEEMQFGGMLTMALLTLTLSFLLPMRTALGTIFSRARWLMAGATSLLFTQFLLQYTMHFRAMGVTQGVFINLLFFVPLPTIYLTFSGNFKLFYSALYHTIHDCWLVPIRLSQIKVERHLFNTD